MRRTTIGQGPAPGPRIAAFGTLLVLAACAASPRIGPEQASCPPPPALSQAVTAPASTVAWLLADLVKTTFPGTDPVPDGPGAAAFRSAGESGGNEQLTRFTVSVRSRVDGSANTTSNGRLLPPRLEFERSAGRSAAAWAADRFRPARSARPDEAGTNPAGGGRSAGELLLEATIEGDRSRCEIEVRFADSVEARVTLSALRDHLVAGLTVLDLAVETADFADLEPCCGHHQILTVPNLFHGALQQIRQRQPRRARALLRRALGQGSDPSVVATLAIVEQMLARPRDAARGWRQLADSAGIHPLAARALRARAARTERQAQTATVHTSLDLSHLDRSIPAGTSGNDPVAEDLDVARRWFDRALRGIGARPRSGTTPVPDPDSLPTTLSLLHRSAGDSRAAFMTIVAEFAPARDSAVPSWTRAIRLAYDSLEFGRPTVGLRVLARHWPTLRQEQDHAHAAITAVRACAEAIGPATTSRVLATERATDLLRRALESWREHANPDRVGIRLFGRLAKLRRRHRVRAEILPSEFHDTTPVAPDSNSTWSLDYELAPGVSPPPPR